MNTLNTLWMGLSLVSGMAVPAACQEPDARTRLATAVEQGIEARLFHGSVWVERDGQVLCIAGHGVERDDGEPMGPDSPVRIASLTKLFTQLTALRMAQAGRLDLDAPVGTLRPTLPEEVRERVTMRHLLTMQAGLPRELVEEHDGSGVEFDSEGRAGPFLDGLVGLAPSFEPGSRAEYSNVGYWIAGAVIEAVNESTWARAVEQWVLEPLELHATRVDRGDGREAGEAWGHRFDDRGEPTLLPPIRVEPRYASGSLRSTARDLARLGRALLEPGFCDAKHHAELFGRFGTASPDERDALTALGHVPGFANILHVRTNEKLVVIVLNNCVRSEPMEMASFATGDLVAAALDRKPPKRLVETWRRAASGLPDLPVARAAAGWLELVRAGDRQALVERHEEFFLPGEFARNGESYEKVADQFLAIRRVLGADFEIYCFRDEAPPEFQLWLRGSGREAKLLFRPAPGMPTHIKDIGVPRL